MKIRNYLLSVTILMASYGVYGQATTTTPPQPQVTPTQPTTTQPQITPAQANQILQLAQKGCQKPIGFFPTPAKLTCLMTALGITDKDAKPKALAMIFNVCHGRTLAAPPAGVTPKSYATLGDCLNDPAAIALINTELKAQGFPEIKVVNTSVLAAPKQ